MRRSPEIIILLGLLLLGIGGILWYVADRRAKNRAGPPPAAARLVPPAPGATTPAAHVSPPPGARPPAPDPDPGLGPVPDQTVVLGGANERKTIDFTSGKAVVKDSAEDQAAIDAALKDIAAARAEVTFEAAKKKAEPPPAPPKS